MCDERKNTDFFKEGIKMSSRKELLTNCGHFSEKLYETHNQFENTTTREHSCLEFLSNIQLSYWNTNHIMKHTKIKDGF